MLEAFEVVQIFQIILIIGLFLLIIIFQSKLPSFLTTNCSDTMKKRNILSLSLSLFSASVFIKVYIPHNIADIELIVIAIIYL